MTDTLDTIRLDLDGLYDAIRGHVGKTVGLNWSGHSYTGPLNAAALYNLTPADTHHHILLSLTTGTWSVYKAEAVWFVLTDIDAGTPAVMYLIDDATPNDSLLPDAHWDALFSEVIE